jgi:hypothetical protein
MKKRNREKNEEMSRNFSSNYVKKKGKKNMSAICHYLFVAGPTKTLLTQSG